MGTLIKPSDLPTWVPGRILSASDGLGWKDAGHRSYRYTGLDVPIPPMDHFMIVRYETGETLMDRCVAGRWSRKRCSPGDFSLLTRSEHSHWHWTGHIDVSHTYLSETLLSRVARDVMDRDVADVRLNDILQAQDAVVTGISDLIQQEVLSPAKGGPLYVEALTIQLSVHLIRKYAAVSFRENAPVGPLSPQQLRRIDEYLEASLHDAVTIEQMAHIAGLGVWTFSKHFRATTGCSPYEYVMTMRVERAVRLLTTGHRVIKEVAAACGFSDQAHLTRILRARTGATPAQHRQQG